MTDTSSLLSVSEIDSLRQTFDSIYQQYKVDPTTGALWAPLYDQLYNLLTDFSGIDSPKTGVDHQSWLWLRGARYVNRGEGPFADLIRDYTIIQYRLRYDRDPSNVVEPSEADMNWASNNIALNFLSQWLGYDSGNAEAAPVGGSEPTILQIGEYDAGPAAARVFNLENADGDPAGWAGTLLFGNLGAPEFWQNLVLSGLYDPSAIGQLGGLPETRDAGSYNAISAAATLQEWSAANAAIGVIFSPSEWTELISTFWAQSTYSNIVDALSSETNAAFKQLYGLSDSILSKDPNPDLGSDTFGFWSTGTDFLKDAHYSVGTFGNDIIGYAPATNGAFLTSTGYWAQIDANLGLGEAGDVVNAGRGNDAVFGTTGSDVLDGGEGYDTLIYLPRDWSGPFSDISISFDGKGLVESRIVVDKTSLLYDQRDIAANFEVLEFDYSMARVADVQSASGYVEEALGNGSNLRVRIELDAPSEKTGTTISRNEIVSISGNLEDAKGTSITINLGLAPVAFNQDVVDASAASTGIYFNMGSGSIVGLNQIANKSAFDLAKSVLAAQITPTNIRVSGANSAIGTNYSDVLISSGGNVASGEGYSNVNGGAGNDLLIGRGWESHLTGGQGKDIFFIGANTVVEDADKGGDSVWMGLPLFGGVKQWWMEGNTAYWSPFSTLLTAFPVIGSEILATAAVFTDVATMKFASYQKFEDGSLGINIGYGLGGVAKIENYSLDFDTGLGSGGISVFETTRAGDASSGSQDQSLGTFTQFINLALKAGFGVGFTGWDPIVLDLDGDGYELTTQRNSGVYFEFDADGFAEKTGWVRPDDGFLVLDANANGLIEDSSEFFGDETQGGFAELSTHDSNADGIINAADAVFTDLKVWRDLNSNGITDAGELFSLSEIGIESISLAAGAPTGSTEIGGNTIAAEAVVTRTDGTTTKAGDVVLDISHIDTRYTTATTISMAAAALPELRGFGNVADLRTAMSENAALLTQVQSFDSLSTNDLAVLKQAAEDILYAWAGVDGIAADPLGSNGFDMRKLAFLEKFSGQEIAPRDAQTGAVSLAGIAELETSWADTLQSLTLRLVIQSAGLPAFAGMTYRGDIDVIVMGAADTLKDVYSAILSGLSADPTTALAEWTEWGELLQAIQDGSRRFDNNVVRDDFAAAQLLAAIAESGTGFDLAALAPPLGISKLRIGAVGTETLVQNGGGTIFSSLDNGDTAVGGTGQDFYLLESGFGAVTINDVEGAKTGDRIRFVDLNRADVSAARVGDNLVLTVTASGDTVTVLGQFADVSAISSDVIISNNRGIEEIQFADGAIMEFSDIAIAVGEGSSGNDVMDGTMHTDVFQGRAGDDLLLGGDDGDLYVFDKGDGHDTIREVQTQPLLMAGDMVIFGDDIAPEDLVFSRSATDASDLVITIGDGSDSITIDNQFAYTSLGYNHVWSPNSRVETFVFRHYGDVYTHEDVQQQLIASETTDGNDVTRGFGDDDFFAPSLGDDKLIGLDGNDSYFFGRGYGNDTIDEQAYYIDVNVGLGGLSLEMGADTIVFAPDIDPADVIFSRGSSAPNLTITLDSGETMTVLDQFAGFQTGPLGAQWFDRIEWFEFGDGTRLSWQDIQLDITTGTNGDDSLWGDLYADTLTGGLGNDYLSGGGYADTYIFNVGDGQDIIEDNNTFILGSGFVTIDTAPDVLALGAGIVEADIGFARSGDDITLIIGTAGDRVTLRGQNDYYDTGVFGAISNDRIERIDFASGASWSWSELNTRVIIAATTSGNDDISGFDLSDRFEASAGNDILRGGDSGDTYVFGAGSGKDTIRESVSNANFDDDDVVEFAAGITAADLALSRSGNDLIVSLVGTTDTLTIKDQFRFSAYFTWNDIEAFRFGDGSEWTAANVRQQLLQSTSGNDHLIGFGDNDYLDGGSGNDILEGKDGSDTYVFAAGYGNDAIRESLSNNNLDDNDRLILSGLNQGDVVFSRVENNLIATIAATGETVTIEGQFNFSNWYAWQDIETFEFADGSTLSAQTVSAQILGGTPGDDNLVGTFRTDVLDGGAGNDVLSGGDGSDIYVFGRGYGTDTIYENLTNANLDEDDELRFGPGIVASDLLFSRSGEDLIISINGTNDSVRLVKQFLFSTPYTWHDVENFAFDDGTSLTKFEVQNILLTGTEADDHIFAFKTGDRLDGREGNDILEGRDGADTYVFGFGYGHDRIIENVTSVLLSDDDTVEFGSGIGWNDLTFLRSGNDLTISLPGGSDTLFIGGQLRTAGASDTYTWTDIENFKFADGSTKSKTDVFVKLLEIASTDGDDVIYDFYGNDIIAGGLGNDLLKGSRGSDTYVYNLGDGHDVVEDYVITWGSSGDRILFGEGISSADVFVTRSASSTNDIVLSLAGGTGSITLRNQSVNDDEWLIDKVEFANGDQWSPNQLASLFVTGQMSVASDDAYGTAWNDELFGQGGDDVLRGLAGNDVLNGEGGNDTLVGGDGSDIYLYELQSGQDTIQDYGTSVSGGNILRFGAGIAAADLIFSTNSSDPSDMVIRFANGTGSITLDNQVLGGPVWGIDQVEFADGTVWDSATLMANYLQRQGSAIDDYIGGDNNANVLAGLAGNDTVVAFGGADSITGGLGNDRLEGGTGSDAYFYQIGDGSDRILDVGPDAADRLVFGPGIHASDVLLDPDMAIPGNMFIRFANLPDEIIVEQQWSSSAGLEFIEFADGTVWDYTFIQQQFTLGQDRAGSQTINGNSGPDTLDGYGGNDTINGGGGNDTLTGGADNDYVVGGAGSDTYVFNLGDGSDTFYENESSFGSTGNDTVLFGVGITLDDLLLTKPTSDWND
ncbi:MAG: calcium-binding protein, partial [Allopontixanthobacter sediminis]